MNPGPDPSASGRHGLGPHVVGARVVVRRVVHGERGPSGGPALTDVLGVCVSWGPEVCVVERESGDRVEIALADVVSGKPVPPRPTPRLRVDPGTAQRRAMALFGDLETEPLDPVAPWVLRHSVGSTARRANSVLAFGTPADPAAAYDAVLAFYAGRGQRPIAAVLDGSAEAELFVERGWVPESGDAETVFALAGVAAARRSLRARGVGVPEDAVRRSDGDLLAVRLGTSARGVAVVDGDWVGFRSIAVAPEHRRQGLALSVMAVLLEWAAERGARTAYLQVLADNAAALALYEGLGFVEHHRYVYLAPADLRAGR